jgi:hypothetical protein
VITGDVGATSRSLALSVCLGGELNRLRPLPVTPHEDVEAGDGGH